jgi:hypothetical protein
MSKNGRMLVGSIDLTKIEKSKIITQDKNGKTFESGSKYLNLVVWINEDEDEYGNIASIQVSNSKEERDAGSKSVYLGNLKQLESKKDDVPSDSAPTDNGSVEDDLPF